MAGRGDIATSERAGQAADSPSDRLRRVGSALVQQQPGGSAADPFGFLLTAAGAALMIASAVIHLHLWSTGYRHIATVGPLFLAQGVATIPLALVVLALRRPLLTLIGAATMIATAFGLLLSHWAGLFAYHESLAVPYAGMSLAVEFGSAAALLAAVVQAAVRRGRAS